MTKELVLIPIVRDELAAIGGSVLLTGRAAHHMTPELLAVLEYTVGQKEDAEYAALALASVAVLTRFGGRLMLVADVDTSPIANGDDPESGACALTRIIPEVMTYWFSEVPGADVPAVAIVACGLDIDTAWGFDKVRELLHESDPLWNDVEEHRRRLRW